MLLDRILYNIRTALVIGKIPQGSVVCDLGCRKDAGFLKKISEKIKYGYGFDIEAGDYKDSKIEVKRCNLEGGTIPLEDNIVDIVVMMAVLEHLNNPDNAVKESFRVLKEGGCFLLTTPSIRAKRILEFLAFKLKVINKGDILEHKKYFNPEEIINIFVNSGFKKENIKWKYFELGFNVLVIARKI